MEKTPTQITPIEHHAGLVALIHVNCEEREDATPNAFRQSATSSSYQRRRQAIQQCTALAPEGGGKRRRWGTAYDNGSRGDT